MGKKEKNKKKGKGAEKTAMKTDKKKANKQKKLLAKIGESAIDDIIATLESEEKRLTEIIETICTCPSPRSNFSIVAHPEKEEIILFGGEFFNGQNTVVYNDLFFYNIRKNEWKLVKSPAGPAARSGHQMIYVASDGGQLWLFGGEHASPSQMQFYHYKDLWVFRLASKQWEKINAPNGPSSRSGHRMILSMKKLIVFGGFHDNNQSYTYFNDVHMFSLESYTWLQITVGGVFMPAPRSGCCLAADVDGRIFVWGGYSKTEMKKDVDRGITHTDMFVLTPDKTNTNSKFNWASIKPKGYKPLPQSSVGVASAPNGKVYCFGGVMDIEEDEEELRGQFGNDLYVFDLPSTTWRHLEILKKEKVGNVKEPVADIEMETKSSASTTTTETSNAAVANALDNIFKITFGSGSSSSSSRVTKNPIAKNEPSVRMNAGLCIVKGTLYIYGGIFEDETGKQFTYNDLYSVDTSKLNEWKVIIPNSLAHSWIDEYDSSSSSEENASDDSDDSDDSDMDTN